MDVDSLVYGKKDLDIVSGSPSCDESPLTLVCSGKSKHSTSEQDVVRHSLDQLPIGILHKVINHLDLVALVCLKNSTRHFYTTISIEQSLLSVCIRWLIHVHFWDDRGIERLEKACMLCKTKRKRRLFRDRDERFILEGPSITCSGGHRQDPIITKKVSNSYLANKRWDKDDRWIPLEWGTVMDSTTLFYNIPQPPKPLVESHVRYALDHIYYFAHGHSQRLDPKSLYRWHDIADGLCYDHLMEQFGSNSTIERLLPSIQTSSRPVWLRFTILRCTHCGRCVEEGDPRKYGCMKCLCDVCLRVIDYQHYRTGPRRTPKPQIRRISMDEKGSVWIHEVGNKEPVPVLLPLSRAGSGKLDPRVIYYAESPRTAHPLQLQQKLPQTPPKIEIIDTRAREPAKKSKVESMTTHIRTGGTTEQPYILDRCRPLNW